MRHGGIICAGLVAVAAMMLCIPALPQAQPLTSPQPNQFVIGQDTFFDFGPPFDFYEVFIVRSHGNGSSIERLTITPPGDACVTPAKVETASASINQPISVLLGSVNPCKIPEKALRHERKRCKNCPVFSGANVVMEVPCGNQSRLIRSDILDRDMFDARTKTPHYTSWTMDLIQRLDDKLGPGVLDTQRIFPSFDAAEHSTSEEPKSAALRDLASGKFDVLFQDARDKPSDLYRQAKIPLPVPIVRLQSSVPVAPDVFVPPAYPPLARLARIEGTVSFKVDVDANGAPTNLTFTSGHPLLRGTIQEAVKGWRFPKDAAGQEVEAMVEFKANCPPPPTAPR